MLASLSNAPRDNEWANTRLTTDEWTRAYLVAACDFSDCVTPTRPGVDTTTNCYSLSSKWQSVIRGPSPFLEMGFHYFVVLCVNWQFSRCSLEQYTSKPEVHISLHIAWYPWDSSENSKGISFVIWILTMKPYLHVRQGQSAPLDSGYFHDEYLLNESRKGDIEVNAE